MTTLLRTPTRTASDVLRSVMQRTLEYDFTVWFWGDAIAFDGLVEAGELLNDQQPIDHCLHFFERWLPRPRIWNDFLTPGFAMLRLYELTGKPSLLDGARALVEFEQTVVPHTRDGLPLYHPDQPAYRHSCWIDSLYHMPSFLAYYANVANEPACFDYALAIWDAHVRVLSSDQGPFLAHSYDTGSHTRRGYAWGRGNGWSTYGAVDLIEQLPEDHPGHARMVEWFRTMCAHLLAVQDSSGFWRTLLNDRAAYLESSTAGFYGAIFTKGVRLGLLGSEYAGAADLAWDAMLSRIDDNGGLFGVSACTYAATAPDDDLATYRRLPTEVNVWGQGSALRFAAERLRAGR